MARLAPILGRDHQLSSSTPRDVAAFCPRYARMNAEDRALFWRTMLTRMARQESAYKTAEPYWEPGQRQYSIGLLQLSLSDEAGYRCGLAAEADLTDPDRNLSCAVRIMAKTVTSAGRIGGDPDHWDKGAAAYWSTLRAVRGPRPDGAPSRDSRAAVIEATSALRACRGA